MGIINTKGEVLAEFYNYAITETAPLNNGNIYFTYISLTENGSSEPYMCCKETGEFVLMPHPIMQSLYNINYSEGLMAVSEGTHSTKYFDKNGVCVIDVSNSSEYYKRVQYASPFEDGEATITFVGMDQNYYEVEIDKTGAWISVARQIEREYASHW